MKKLSRNSCVLDNFSKFITFFMQNIYCRKIISLESFSLSYLTMLIASMDNINQFIMMLTDIPTVKGSLDPKRLKQRYFTIQFPVFTGVHIRFNSLIKKNKK